MAKNNELVIEMGKWTVNSCFDFILFQDVFMKLTGLLSSIFRVSNPIRGY